MNSRFQSFGEVDFWQPNPLTIATGLSEEYGATSLEIHYFEGNTYVVAQGCEYAGDDVMAFGIVTPEEALLDYLRVMVVQYAQS